LEQIQNEIPTSDRSDLLDDALASYFGPDGNGRMRALGLGMTKTKYSILSERDDNLQALQDKCNKTEADVKELQEIISLWRPTSEMSTIEEAISSNVAWPADKILKGYVKSLLVANLF